MPAEPPATPPGSPRGHRKDRRDPREELAAAQAELLAALVAAADPPPGFDAERLRVQAEALTAKRRRVAAAHHPWLAEALGTHYADAFAEYARTSPLRAGCTGHADAEAFEAHLRGRGDLPNRPKGRLRRGRR